MGSRAGSQAGAPDEPVNIVRFTETINGRVYAIDVLAVAPDRWRAQIARRPGATTALMPFYGTTPDEAAHQLRGWLTRITGQSA